MTRCGLILFLSLMVPVIFFESGCAKEKAEPGPGVKTESETDENTAQSIAQKILSFNLVGHRDNGQKKWELNALSADVLPNVIKMDYITAKAYGKDGSLTLKARTGVYDKITKNVHLEKNVIGKSSDGARLTTDSLDWNQKTESVSTNALVRIEKDNLVSIGKGALGNPALKEVELKKDITVEIRDNPPTVITCDGPLVVNYKNNISILNKNVRIADPRCEITSDVMKILFNPKTRKITRAVAIGNVVIKRDGNITNSGRAIYTVSDGRIRLVGKPRISVFPKETPSIDKQRADQADNAFTGNKRFN
ncbi:MAG: LPS export ABC transporter periplasmic protein LptC [Candidatus Omnitrophica bacterium]|nr:LPS export ABC transporter periplasmic protein LptC [Candidatus Omnitrophota bacterium]